MEIWEFVENRLGIGDYTELLKLSYLNLFSLVFRKSDMLPSIFPWLNTVINFER